MESTFFYAYLIGFAVSIAALIAFFNLCTNVSAIKKHLLSQSNQVTPTVTKTFSPVDVEERPEWKNDTIESVTKSYGSDKFNMKLTPTKRADYLARFKRLGLSDTEIETILSN